MTEQSPTRLYETAERWAAAYRADLALAVNRIVAGDKTWVPVLTEPFAVGNLAIIELQSGAALAEEGVRMQTCVESYTQSCFDGQKHIFSVRAATGCSLSTAEIRIVRIPSRGASLEVIQHKGTNNSNPSQVCSAALGALLNAVKKEPYASRIWALYVARTRGNEQRGSGRNVDQMLSAVETLRATLTGKHAFGALVKRLKELL